MSKLDDVFSSSDNELIDKFYVLEDESLKLEIFKKIKKKISLEDIEQYIEGSELKVEIIEALIDDIEKKPRKDFDVSPIGLPREMTIGIEIEFEGLGGFLAYEIFNIEAYSSSELLKKFQRRLDLSEQEKNEISKWEFKEDGSLDMGMEIVSPILYDTKMDWENLETVCWFLQNIEGVVTENCGGHVHIGVNILGCNDESWKNFIAIWNEAEEIIYKMSNAENDVCRKGVLDYASISSNDIQHFIDEGSIHIANEDDLNELAEVWPDKYLSLNLSNLGDKDKNTIEFRLSNGTIDAKTIKENITLYGSILALCSARGENPEYNKEKFNYFMNRKLSETEKAKAFVDLIFNDEYNKQIFMSRFYSIMDAPIYEKLISETPKFEHKKGEER